MDYSFYLICTFQRRHYVKILHLPHLAHCWTGNDCPRPLRTPILLQIARSLSIHWWDPISFLISHVKKLCKEGGLRTRAKGGSVKRTWCIFTSVIRLLWKCQNTNYGSMRYRVDNIFKKTSAKTRPKTFGDFWKILKTRKKHSVKCGKC